MHTTIVGGAMLPHAPQFFTMPETEDKKTVARVKKVAAKIGKKLKALEPDLWIIFSNDHAEQFFHNTAPPFTLHVGGEASGKFAGHSFHWKIQGEIALELVRQRIFTAPAYTRTLIRFWTGAGALCHSDGFAHGGTCEWWNVTFSWH